MLLVLVFGHFLVSSFLPSPPIVIFTAGVACTFLAWNTVRTGDIVVLSFAFMGGFLLVSASWVLSVLLFLLGLFLLWAWLSSSFLLFLVYRILSLSLSWLVLLNFFLGSWLFDFIGLPSWLARATPFYFCWCAVTYKMAYLTASETLFFWSNLLLRHTSKGRPYTFPFKFQFFPVQIGSIECLYNFINFFCLCNLNKSISGSKTIGSKGQSLDCALILEKLP